MRFEPRLMRATLLRRYQRFLAEVEVPGGERLVVHCPNTGALTGCVEPGNVAWLSSSSNPRRKYRHTLQIVETSDGHRVGIESALANRLVEEALERGAIPELPATAWAREPRVGESTRFDFGLTVASSPFYVEVKSVSWHVGRGRGAFPDARSPRATRQLRALTAARGEGVGAALFFCVQHDGVERVVPADDIDPEFAGTLRIAADAGVALIAYRCTLDAAEIRIVERVPVDL